MDDTNLTPDTPVIVEDADLPPLLNCNFSHAVSLGSLCYPSGVFKRLGLKRYSCPFDWMFTDLPMVTDCIETKFVHFLDRQYYQEAGLHQGRMEYKHTYYKTYWRTNFTHYDPVSDEGYTYMQRCVDRFHKLLLLGEPKLFLFVASIHPPERKHYVDKFRRLHEVITSRTDAATLMGVTTFKTDDDAHGFVELDTVDGSRLLNYTTRSNLGGIKFADPADDVMFDDFVSSLFKPAAGE